MSILKIKDRYGNFIGVPSIKGDKGDTGETGPKGDTGATGPKGDKGDPGNIPDDYIPFVEEAVEDLNTLTTTCVVKTAQNYTANLPEAVQGTFGEWGVVACYVENSAYGTGTQLFYPVNGEYAGRVFARSILDMNTTPQPSEWTLLATTDDIPNIPYATDETPGLIKTGYGLQGDATDGVWAQNMNYDTYNNASNWHFISKGTLEAVIAGKELVDDTELNEALGAKVSDVKVNGTSILDDNKVANIPYATMLTRGVIRAYGEYGTNVAADGTLLGVLRSSSQYSSLPNYHIISKGTLDNVLATPSIMPTLSDSEKSSARQRIGIVTLTQEEYNLIETPNEATIYVIVG